MGPTSGVPLPAREAAGKAVSEMARGERSAHPPAGRDGRERVKDEAAMLQSVVRNFQPPRAEAATTPQRDVEIQYPSGPMLAATTTEVPLDGLQLPKHFQRFQRALNQRDGIGEVATGAADGGVEDDRRSFEQPEFLVEPRDGCFDHLLRPSEAAVRAVRPDRDGVKVRCVSHDRSPR